MHLIRKRSSRVYTYFLLSLLIVLCFNEITISNFDPSPPLGAGSSFIIRSCDLLVLCLGLISIQFTVLGSVAGLGYSVIIFSAFFSCALFACEMIVRNLYPSIIQFDDELGWKLSADADMQFTSVRLDNSVYNIDFSTNNLGLRLHGDEGKSGFQILVLGDSFTGGAYASNDSMWFSAMAQHLTMELDVPDDYISVQAGGAGGYGSYQNLLLAKRLVGIIKPDLFILQFCDNDFSNNMRDMEVSAIIRNQALRRPYFDLDSGKTVYQEGFIANVFRSTLGNTQIFRRVDDLITQIQFGLSPSESHNILDRLNSSDRQALVEISALTTEIILTELRNMFDDIPALLTNCASDQSSESPDWKDIGRRAGYVVLDSPSNFIKEAHRNGSVVNFNKDGGHLSDIGNLMYGKILADEMLSYEFIKSNILTPPVDLSSRASK